MNNRIPFEYFVTSGKGSSKYEIHAGSYHMALYDANISDYNIQVYSSVLPSIATEIKQDSIKIPFGSELYTIMSCIHGKKNEYISCGIIFGDLFDPNNNYKKIGSLVCEVSGNYDEDTVLKQRLHEVINELHQKTYLKYNIDNFRIITNSHIPDDEFGTCLVAVCFTSFIS